MITSIIMIIQGSAAAARPVSLMDRMSKLNEAQGNWQKKVEVKVMNFYWKSLKGL